MKVYKRFSTAQKYTEDDGLIVQCGDFYIVGMKSSDEIVVMQQDGLHVGWISRANLERLGNGNRATVLPPGTLIRISSPSR